jgi:hypothetical protein
MAGAHSSQYFLVSFGRLSNLCRTADSSDGLSGTSVAAGFAGDFVSVEGTIIEPGAEAGTESALAGISAMTC